MLEDLAKPPADPSTARSSATGAILANILWAIMATGECAGEVVLPMEFDLAAAEREVFEAQIAFDGGQGEEAGNKAYLAMLQAARGAGET